MKHLKHLVSLYPVSGMQRLQSVQEAVILEHRRQKSVLRKCVDVGHTILQGRWLVFSQLDEFLVQFIDIPHIGEQGWDGLEHCVTGDKSIVTLPLLNDPHCSMIASDCHLSSFSSIPGNAIQFHIHVSWLYISETHIYDFHICI